MIGNATRDGVRTTGSDAPLTSLYAVIGAPWSTLGHVRDALNAGGLQTTRSKRDVR